MDTGERGQGPGEGEWGTGEGARAWGKGDRAQGKGPGLEEAPSLLGQVPGSRGVQAGGFAPRGALWGSSHLMPATNVGSHLMPGDSDSPWGAQLQHGGAEAELGAPGRALLGSLGRGGLGPAGVTGNGDRGCGAGGNGRGRKRKRDNPRDGAERRWAARL